MRKYLIGLTLGFLMVVASAAHAGGVRIGIHGPIVINGGGVTVAIGGGGYPVMTPAPVVVPMYRVYNSRPVIIQQMPVVEPPVVHRVLPPGYGRPHRHW